MNKMTAYSVVELTQESNEEKVISDNLLFSTRENALAYLHSRYLDIRLGMDGDEFASEWSDDGYYSCVNTDGDCYEGYVSECLAVDAAITPEIVADWNERGNGDKE